MSASSIFPDWPAPANVSAVVLPGENAATIDAAAAAWWSEIDSIPLVLPSLEQVHGTEVVRVEQAAAGMQADACTSRSPGQACLVRTADCLPLLLCNLAGTEVAAIHAGWRGLAAGVIERAVEHMESPAAELVAWMGPAISQRHFEVGGEVLDHFLEQAEVGTEQATRACFLAEGQKYRADLYALARLRLNQTGIEQVFGGDQCTFAESGRFPSYRRQGDSAGRIYSLIAIHNPT